MRLPKWDKISSSVLTAQHISFARNFCHLSLEFIWKFLLQMKDSQETPSSCHDVFTHRFPLTGEQHTELEENCLGMEFNWRTLVSLIHNLW